MGRTVAHDNNDQGDDVATMFHQLKALAEQGRPVRVGLIGAGKFGSMFLSQVPRTPGLHLLGIADLSPARAQAALARVGWKAEQYAARSWDEALRHGTTFVQDDAEALISQPQLDIIIDATGSPAAGIRHTLLCCEYKILKMDRLLRFARPADEKYL